MAITVNKDMQDYFVKLAPDFSVFELAEKYYYDKNLSSEQFNDLFFYKGRTEVNAQSGLASVATQIFRGMFLVYSDGDISVESSDDDEYTVLPYRGNSQIVICVKNSQATIRSTTAIDLLIGVAF
jgi:hypothetical protein